MESFALIRWRREHQLPSNWTFTPKRSGCLRTFEEGNAHFLCRQFSLQVLPPGPREGEAWPSHSSQATSQVVRWQEVLHFSCTRPAGVTSRALDLPGVFAILVVPVLVKLHPDVPVLPLGLSLLCSPCLQHFPLSLSEYCYFLKLQSSPPVWTIPLSSSRRHTDGSLIVIDHRNVFGEFQTHLHNSLLGIPDRARLAHHLMLNNLLV